MGEKTWSASLSAMGQDKGGVRMVMVDRQGLELFETSMGIGESRDSKVRRKTKGWNVGWKHLNGELGSSQKSDSCSSSGLAGPESGQRSARAQPESKMNLIFLVQVWPEWFGTEPEAQPKVGPTRWASDRLEFTSSPTPNLDRALSTMHML